MSQLIWQYFRDLYILLTSKRIHKRSSLFFFYHWLCIKIIFSKLSWLKIQRQKFREYVIYFDNFSSFFAIFCELFIYNVYYFETGNHKPFIVDCGANIGMATIYFKYLYPEAVIECYEPDKWTFILLQKNITENQLKNVVAHNKAISEKNGELEFFSFADMEGGPGNSLEKSQAKFAHTNVYKVPVVALSSLEYGNIDYLKIDIEWSEGGVFRDLNSSWMIDKVDQIWLEYHYDEEIHGNELSGILTILEQRNRRVIINANVLVSPQVDEYLLSKWDDRYVLMISAYPKPS